MPPKETQGHIASTTALARHLGLSRWTISRVLNGHSEVKPETTRRVREAMDKLGFIPSPLGRALRGARTGVVGVCFQALGSPIVARKIATLQTILRAAGYRTLFEVTDGNPAIEMEVIRHFLAMKVDGMVLVGGMTDENSARITTLLSQRNVPAVLVDPMRRLSLPTVELDREHGMRLALEHLLELGHSRFALFGIDETVAYGQARWSGMRKVAAERALSWETQFIPLSESGTPELDFAYGRRLAELFLQLPQRPTAILALNDQVAIGAMARLQQAGLAIPSDLSIVGFDNLDVSAHVNPRLTTIDQHVQQLMQTSVALLTEHTDRRLDAGDTHRAIHPLLVHRETTGPAPRR